MVLIEINSTAIESGISAIIIVITGWLAGLSLINRNRKEKNKLLVYAGIFLCCGGSFYLGTVVSFFSLIFTGNNIATILAGQLCYMWAPIGAAFSMYVGFSIFKPELSKRITQIYLISGIIYWILMFGFPNENISSDIITGEIAQGGLIDIHLTGGIMIMTAIYLIGFLFILCGGFLNMAKKTTGLIKRKAIMHAISYLLFVFVGVVDALFNFSTIIAFFRIFMVIAFVLIYYTFVIDSPSYKPKLEIANTAKTPNPHKKTQ